VPAASVTSVTSGQFDIALPTDLKPGCWDVQVKAGGLSSNHSDKFAIEPRPTLDSAVRTDKSIVVTGTDLVDFAHCGGPKISFQLLKEGSTTAVPVEVLDWNNGKPVLSLPEAAKKDTWKVQVLLDGTLAATHGEAELKTISQ
jgi:hypothetical protein